MSIKITKPGIFTTVQDLGRTRFLNEAVPVSGAMDLVSAKIANLLVGNDVNAALIEIVDGNFECITQATVLIALVSNNEFFKIDNKLVPTNRPIFTPKNSTVKLSNNAEGRYSYCAIAGGWDVPELLGSKSTYVTAGFGGHHGRLLKKDDELIATEMVSQQSKMLFHHLTSEAVNYPSWSIPAKQFLPTSKSTVRIIAGREFDWFEDLSIADFLTKAFHYSNGNRMGYRLEGPIIERKKSRQNELLSTAVVPGTIQVTGEGTLILLMADCQTTGGYPRLAKTAEVDLPICAQLKPGQAIQFELINIKEAEKLYLDLQLDLQKLATAIQLKTAF